MPKRSTEVRRNQGSCFTPSPHSWKCIRREGKFRAVTSKRLSSHYGLRLHHLTSTHLKD